MPCRMVEPTDFYPRPPRGGRPTLWLLEPFFTEFLSTPSARRATGWSLMPSSESFNFYPRPPRGGRQADLPPDHYHRTISIHALREEGDPSVFNSAGFQLISIHALREEGDRKPLTERSEVNDFYPRPPRGGRPLSCMTFFWPFDFYPRPPRGGRPPFPAPLSCGQNFYPRPPRGGRPALCTVRDELEEFLSTPSARRATT